MVALAFSQNLLAILLSPYSFTLARAVLVAKEGYIAGILLLGVLVAAAALVRGEIPVHAPILAICGIIGALALCAIVSPAFNWLSFRQLLIIPLLMLYGAFFSTRTELRFVWTIVFALLIAVCLSGYVERFVFYDQEEQFWRMAGVSTYMQMKGFASWAYGPWGIPGNFYSADLIPVIGVSVRRMTSLLIGDPTLLGQVLVVPFLYAWFSRRWLWAVVFGFAIVSALSKGGILGCVLGLGLWVYQRHGRRAAKVLVPVTLTAAGIGIMALVRSGAVASLVFHFRGLTTNILAMAAHPFGQGIGAAGNFAALAAESGGLSTAAQSLVATGESYLGIVIGQLGLLGLGAYVGLAWWLWRRPVMAGRPVEEAIKYGALATLAVGVGSESAISYVGGGYIFALAGFLWVGRQAAMASAPGTVEATA